MRTTGATIASVTCVADSKTQTWSTILIDTASDYYALINQSWLLPATWQKRTKWLNGRCNSLEFCPGDSDEPSRHLVVSMLNNAQSHTLKFNMPLHNAFTQFNLFNLLHIHSNTGQTRWSSIAKCHLLCLRQKDKFLNVISDNICSRHDLNLWPSDLKI